MPDNFGRMTSDEAPQSLKDFCFPKQTREEELIYKLEHRDDGFAVTVGLMEYISGWSALEILYWLNEKQAIPRRYDNARRH